MSSYPRNKKCGKKGHLGSLFNSVIVQRPSGIPLRSLIASKEHIWIVYWIKHLTTAIFPLQNRETSEHGMVLG